MSQVPMGNTSLKTKKVYLPLALLDILTRIRRHKYSITHLFYADVTTIFFLPYFRWPWRRGKCVATIHNNFEIKKFSKLFISILRRFDAIITLSSQQQQLLKEKYGIDSWFIPHGFSHPEFTFDLPADSLGRTMDPDKINIVTVGKQYRDFDTFGKIVEAKKEDSRLQFHLVGAPAEAKERFKGYPNVHIYNFLPDDQFYSVIQSADWCFLPLTFATANNTLLEAQYLGLPLIVTNIEGVRDYALQSEPNKLYSTYESLLEIFDNIEKRHKSNTLKSYAREFDWTNIYHSIRTLYFTLDPDLKKEYYSFKASGIKTSFPKNQKGEDA